MPKKIELIILFFAVPILLSAQKIKKIEFKEINILNRIQIQSLDMLPEDKDLIVFDKDQETFLRYTGTVWMDIGEGGDFRSALLKNEENLEFRKTMVTKKLPRDTTKKYIIRLDKKVRQHMVLNEQDDGLIIYEGEFKIFSKGNWSRLGKGGNFGALLNRQKSISGLKEGFLTNWRRAFGFGLHGGIIYPSLFRDEVYPSNPFLNGLSSGWEVGLTQNMVYKRFFQSRMYITYNHIVLTETFRSEDANDVTATWTLAGPKIAVLPIMITPGSENFKVSIGAGAYARYHLTKELSTNVQDVLVTGDDFIEPFEYGFLAQLGFQVYRFNIDINATNQANTFIKSDWVQLLQEIQRLKLKTFSLNISFNF